MKSIIALLCLFTNLAFASGSLSVEPSYDWQRERVHYALGLGIYEPLFKGAAYNSWTGFGNDFKSESNFHSWYVTKHSVDVNVTDALVISPGVKVNLLDDQETDYKKRLYGEALVKISYKLW